MKKKHNFYLNYLSGDFNKKDNSFFIKKLNQHKEQVINKAANDKKLSSDDKNRLIKSIEELNQKQIEQLKKKDQWTNEEVDNLFAELNRKYQYLIDELEIN